MQHRAKRLLLLAAGAFTLFGALQALAQQGRARTFFELADGNKDGFVTKDEMQAAMAAWLSGSTRATQEQLTRGIEATMPESLFMQMISPPQNREPKAEDAQKMMAALPEKAPATPAKPRKILVLNKCAGFVHSSIPLAAKTVEELGRKTGAWTTTVSYEADVITAENLKQYDAVFLNNTTGFFLDDPDPKVTAARKKALLDFVRSGKGLAGIHAASDSYHVSEKGPEFVGRMAAGVFRSADKNDDKVVDAAELSALGDAWFETIDTAKAGKVAIEPFRGGFRRVLFASGSRPGGNRPAGPPPSGRPGPDPQVAAWPEFNRMIGGYFKYHWLDPQHIVYKIDDPASPLTAMFRGGFEVNDETYTFGMRDWSRRNLRVLTSIDYSKMSDADKAKEDYPRADHDYGLSWVKREGKGRVFYTAHGHSERVYAIRPMLEHLLAGIQYALGDLKANDAPSVSAKE